MQWIFGCIFSTCEPSVPRAPSLVRTLVSDRSSAHIPSDNRPVNPPMRHVDFVTYVRHLLATISAMTSIPSELHAQREAKSARQTVERVGDNEFPLHDSDMSLCTDQNVTA